MNFKLVSDFKPTGDQPKAIKEIVAQFQNQDPFVTLQGVTGSGKTFTMANAVQELQRPTLVLLTTKLWQPSSTLNSSNFFQRMPLSISFPITTTTNLKPISLPVEIILKKIYL